MDMHQSDVLTLPCLLLHVLVRRKAHFLTNLLEGGLKKGEDGIQPFLLPCDGEISSENFFAISHQFCLLPSVKTLDPLVVCLAAVCLPLKPRFATAAFSQDKVTHKILTKT